MNLFWGIFYGFLGQILSFLQLQASVKYNWFEKYPLIVLGSAIPAAWFYIKSVEYFIQTFNGELWPSRLLGFGIGVVVFTALSYMLFNETFTSKTIICLILAVSIICIQLFWR